MSIWFINHVRVVVITFILRITKPDQQAILNWIISTNRIALHSIYITRTFNATSVLFFFSSVNCILRSENIVRATPKSIAIFHNLKKEINLFQIKSSHEKNDYNSVNFRYIHSWNKIRMLCEERSDNLLRCRPWNLQKIWRRPCSIISR